MTDDQLRAIRERAEAATAGPWRVGHVRLAVRMDSTNVHPFASQIQVSDSWPLCQFLDHRDGTLQDPGPAPNAEFIASARTDVPALLEEVARLEERCAAYERELRRMEGALGCDLKTRLEEVSVTARWCRQALLLTPVKMPPLRRLLRSHIPFLTALAVRLISENTALRATLASVQRQLEGQCREACGPEFRDRDLHSGACLHYIADEIKGTVAALAGDAEKD